MKRIVLLALAAGLAFTACHEKSKVENNPAPVSEANGKQLKIADLASNKDVVCGMNLEGQTIADTTMYRGAMYGFCAVECKAEFLKNPKSYLTQQ